MRPFRVVMIDDDPVVLERARDQIDGARGVRDSKARVDLFTIQVPVTRGLGGAPATFDEKPLLNDLEKAAGSRADLILVDYSYFVNVDKAREIVRAQVAAGRRPGGDELAQELLTIENLALWVREGADITASRRKNFCRNLFDSGAPVYLYSFTGAALLQAVGDMDVRVRRTERAFPKSHVARIDTMNEFFGGPGHEGRYEPDFYAHLVSVFLRDIVKKEALFAQLEARKYLQLPPWVRSSAAISAMAAATACVGGWLGDWVRAMLPQASGEGASATLRALTIVSASVILFVIAIFIPLIFERMMRQIVSHRESEDG